jgi:hypothetical protein
MPDGLWLMPDGASTELVPHTWPMNLGHGEWLEEMATKHGLTVDSALRQLIFVANGEAADIKRVSVRAGQGWFFLVAHEKANAGLWLAWAVAHIHSDVATRVLVLLCDELMSAQQLAHSHCGRPTAHSQLVVVSPLCLPAQAKRHTSHMQCCSFCQYRRSSPSCAACTATCQTGPASLRRKIGCCQCTPSSWSGLMPL